MARSIIIFGALFALLAILPTTLSQSVTIGYAEETGDPMSFQTSTWSLSFRWSLDGATAPEYQIGNAINPDKYRAWTPMVGPFASPSVSGDFYPEIVTGLNFQPEDDVIVVIRNPSNSDTATSAAIKVGSAQRFSCPAFWDPEPVFGTTVTPPQPVVSATWDAATQKMAFTVEAEYLQWGRLWYVDFNEFTADHTKGQNGLALGSCENRATSSLSGRSFGEYFNAAPASNSADGNAGSPNSLDNPNYLAYNTDGSKWDIAAPTSCSKVTYSAAFFPSELAACTGDQALPITVTTDIASGKVIYSGTLFVEAVAPKDFNDASAGFQVTRFQYPFQFTFNIAASAVIEGESSLTLSYQIDRVALTPIGNDFGLVMRISTNTMNAAFGLDNPFVVDDATTGIVFTNSPAPAQAQVWDLGTTTGRAPGQQYDGDYQFSWRRSRIADQSDDTTEAITVKVKMSIVEVVINAATLNIELGFYADSTFTGVSLPNPTFTRADVVYIRSIVKGQNALGDSVALDATQNNQFKNQVWNVWLCYTTDDSVPSSCQIETAKVRAIGRILSDGTAVTTGALAKYGAVTYVNRNSQLIQAGVSFEASALLGSHVGTFFIEIESRIVDPAFPTKKRATASVLSSLNEMRTGLDGFTFTDSVSDPGSFASFLAPSSSIVFLFLGVVMMLLAF